MAAPVSKKYSLVPLWRWERATVPTQQFNATPLPAGWLTLSTLAFFLLMLGLAASHGAVAPWWAILPLLARLAALDAHLRILPDIYTLPLILCGIVFQLWLGQPLVALWGILFVVALLVIHFTLCWLLRTPFGIGGGDIKLMLAIGAFLGWEGAPLAFLCAGVFTFPFFFMAKWRPVPFGPGLCMALLIFLALFWQGTALIFPLPPLM